MKIAILGYNLEGQSSYEYLASQGHEITIHDQNSDIQVPPGLVAVLGDNYLDNLGDYDLTFRTAGLHPRLILDKNPGLESKITTHLNEFLAASPTQNIIAVTGTKGKGTTSSLITKMLEADGKDVRLGGNIGLPPLSFINELNEESYVVLEVSSFQAIDLRHSPHIGVCLMVVSEHLDWHADLEEYVHAKANLFARQTPDDTTIYFVENSLSKQIATTGSAMSLPYYATPGALVLNNQIVINDQTVCDVGQLKLLGEHNWQNACAAVTAVWQASQNVEAIRSVLTTFSGLEHRLELVSEIDGVRYYDDSFGTTPETAIVALQAFDQPKIAILGGSDKGADYGELAQTVASSGVKTVLLIGEQAPRIQEALEKAGFNSFAPGGSTMTEIVNKAGELAAAGDVVLLAPACASFDMFENYKDRGEQFKSAVRALV